MTPLEEQVENLARAIAQEQLAQMGEPPVELAEMPNDIRLDLFAQAEAAYYALLPLEVTDGEARTKPYRCADCDQPHGPFNNIGSGQSNKPEVTYRLVCDRCWGPKPAAPVRVTDEMVEAGAKAMLTHERPWMDGQHPENQAGGIERRREAARACLSAALTQKGDNE